jgi:hypothetical protein
MPSIKKKHGLWCGHICQRKAKSQQMRFCTLVLLFMDLEIWHIISKSMYNKNIVEYEKGSDSLHIQT